MKVEFIQSFENRVKKTIDDYGLIKPEEKIAVACSGGKDSTAVLYILHDLGYDIEAITVNLHIGTYSERNVECVKKACEELGVKLHVVTFRQEYGCSVCYIRSILKEKHGLNSCSVCGVIRRTMLNKKAREIGVDRIATGHNLDDEAQTVLMNFLQGNITQSAKMGPQTGQIKDDKFVPRIKPLFFSKEEDIIKYSKLKNFPVIYEPCPCSRDTFRTYLKAQLNELEKEELEVKMNLVKGMLEIVPDMRETYKKTGKMQYCEKCGEPASNKLCKPCELFEKLKD